MRKITATLLAVLLLMLPLLNTSVYSMEVTPESAETASTATNNITTAATFEEDSVIVIMTNTASLSKFHYETSDFSEVGCKSIVNLSQATTEDVELQLSKNTEPSSRTSGSNESISELVELDTYNQILQLKLQNPGKANVIDAI